MHDLELFQQALGVVEPWKVAGVEFDVAQRRLDLWIDFARGSRFACPECDRAGCAVKDT
jgi:transposase